VKALLSLFILGTFLIIPVASYADLDDESYGAEKQVDPQEQAAAKLNFVTDVLAPASVSQEKGKIHADRVKYASSNVNFDMGIYSNPGHQEGLYLSTGWTRTKLHWEHNPFFRQRFFDTLTFAFNAFSARCQGWTWLGRAAINVSTNHFEPSRYASYDFLLWGTSELPQWSTGHFHVGVLAQTGMKIDRVFPILGVDWQATENLKINLVFPINIGVAYSINDAWKASVNGRFFSTRYRINESGVNRYYSQGLIEYQNQGLEANLSYDYRYASANIHAGYMFGGRMKISNRHHRRGIWFDIGGSPYLGAEFAAKF
jgi:hypothetical protein